MIGVDSIEPNTPPLEIEKVPPVRSSSVSLPSCALLAELGDLLLDRRRTDIWSASRRIGTTSPRGLPTATPTSK